MKSRFAGLRRNPLIVIPPFVIILVLGWQQYTYAGRALSLPEPTLNLLTNGGFSSFDSNGVPTGWQLAKSGNSTYAVSKTAGYADGSSFQLTVSDYYTGDTTVTSPKVAVKAGQPYLFKGYYNTTAPFALLARYYYADGSSSLQFVRTYTGDASTWTTASDAFTAPENLAAVQFVYSLSANGQLQLNDLYLEPQEDVSIAPVLTSKNTVPNSSLAAGDYNTPTSWSTYHTGRNIAAFSYQQDTGGAYLQTQMNGYRDGQAKWQYQPQAVEPQQYYQASLSYQSDTAVPLVAEYVLQNGQRQDQTIAQLPPADSWTNLRQQFQVPADATTLFLSVPLQHNGTVDSRNYNLINITKSGPTAWQQPLVSLTFDDGWQQAYQNAAPLLQQDGYKATFYINPATIETPNFMTASELTTLSNEGNEIAAHGYDHADMTGINESELDYQLHQGRDYLRNAGFQVTDFAPPYGRSDAEVQWYARQYFTTLRGSDPGINTLQNVDPYNLKVLYVTSTTKPQTISDALQQAKQQHGWLIISYHQVGSSVPNAGSLTSENTTITADALKQQLGLVHASGIKVLPISAAYAALQPKSNPNQ